MSEQSEPTANDQEAQPRRTPPPPRRRTSPKRTPPPPRRGGSGNGNGNGNGHDADAPPAWASGLIDRFDRVERRLDQVERGGVRFVESEAEPIPDQRAVNPEAMDPFTRKLWEERTRDTPDNYGGDREPAYNIPLRWYLKNDGSYVQLQGDAKSRAYYVDKGYHCLSPDEVAEYEKLKPGIVAVQRERAHLKTAIVQLVHTDAALVGHRDGVGGVVFDIDLMSADEMRAKWHSLNAETSQPDRPLPPPKRWRSEGRDRMMDGVETNASVSMEEVEAKVARAQRSGRAIEVTSANWNQFT